MTRRGRVWRTAVAACGGAATYAGFAPSTWWWSPILGLALLGCAVRGQRAGAAALLGGAFGAAFFLPLLTWSGIYVGNVPWLALSLAEAALVAPAMALTGPLSRRFPVWWPLGAACLWVTGETLRSAFPFGGFPWGGVAFSQPDGPLLPVVTILGEAGLSFAVALAGFAVAELIVQACLAVRPADGVTAEGRTGTSPAPPRPTWSRRRAVVAAALVALPFVGGCLAGWTAVVPAAGDAGRTVAVIQGNVPEPGLEFNARRRAVLDMHAAETGRLADAVEAGRVPKPVAVIWPENSSDIDPYRNQDAAEVIDAAARRIGAPILVGAVVAGPRPKTVYNMGIVWDPVTGPGATYTKRRPVPFGEYMPWRGFFRIFSDKVDLVRADFLPGDAPGNLEIGDVAIGDVICFEIVENDVVRDVVRGGAQVIVVQTNNATFGYSDETYQQQAMSRVRAVEYRRPVLIASTSGISTIIAPDGSVTDQIGLFTAGWMTTTVPSSTVATPSIALGAPVEWTLTLGGLIVGAVAWWRDRWIRRHGRPGTIDTTGLAVGGAEPGHREDGLDG